MCFLDPTRLPEGWAQVPSVAEGNKDLDDQILTNIQYRHAMPDEYHANIGIRVLAIALLIIGTSVGVMALKGTLTSFPENFMHFFQNVNWMYVGAGAIALTVLTIGAAMVIHKVQHQHDRYTKSDSGSFTGDATWVSALYIGKHHGEMGYIDTATLDENGNGLAYMYAYKDEQAHYGVSVLVTAVTPIVMAAAIVYNIIRIVIVPFYILGCLLYEACTGTEIEAKRPYTVSDIPIEVGRSIKRIVLAPFHALAFMYASLYSFFDPLNGRKLGAYVEREWNEGTTRAEGFWSVRGPQSLFRWGVGPSDVSRNVGFYLAGCWQPIARVKFENGVVTGESLSHAVNSSEGQVYQIHTPSTTEARHAKLLGLQQ